jgi:hypothetical protein
MYNSGKSHDDGFLYFVTDDCNSNDISYNLCLHTKYWFISSFDLAQIHFCFLSETSNVYLEGISTHVLNKHWFNVRTFKTGNNQPPTLSTEKLSPFVKFETNSFTSKSRIDFFVQTYLTGWNSLGFPCFISRFIASHIHANHIPEDYISACPYTYQNLTKALSTFNNYRLHYSVAYELQVR